MSETNHANDTHSHQSDDHQESHSDYGPTMVGQHWPGTLMDAMGMEVTQYGPDCTSITMPLEGNTQRIGILHGGASAALAETAGSLAAGAHAYSVGGPDAYVVGVELSISHLRAGTKGPITATTRAAYLGGSSTVHLVSITDGDERLIGTARISNRVLKRR